MTRRAPLVPTFLLTVVAVAGFATPASAIGFGIGLEGGGFVGGAQLASGGLTRPSQFGGGGALMLRLEFLTEDMFSLHATLRGEGNGFALADLSGAGGGGAGGAGGGELLFRALLRLPVVNPFLELGGGAMAGGGAGTVNLESVGGAVDEGVAGVMWAPAGYIGAGLNIALPLLPYFEVRLGTHVGGLLPIDDSPPFALSGIEQLSGRAELWVGTGFQI